MCFCNLWQFGNFGVTLLTSCASLRGVFAPTNPATFFKWPQTIVTGTCEPLPRLKINKTHDQEFTASQYGLLLTVDRVESDVLNARIEYCLHYSNSAAPSLSYIT